MSRDDVCTGTAAAGFSYPAEEMRVSAPGTIDTVHMCVQRGFVCTYVT